MASAAAVCSIILVSAVILNGAAQVVTQPPASSPTLDPTYLMNLLNATDVNPKNKTTGVVTLEFLRSSPRIVGPYNISLNNFTTLNTAFELLIMPNATTNQSVFVVGEISLLETELPNVTKVLCNFLGANVSSGNVTATGVMNLTISAIHNHMIGETPKLIFIHMSATGPLNQTTTLIQQILNQTTILRPSNQTRPTNQTQPTNITVTPSPSPSVSPSALPNQTSTR